MKWLTAMIKKKLHIVRLKYRFPESVIYPGVTLDAKSSLGVNSVVFEHVQLIDTNLGKCSYVQSNSKFISTEVGSFCSIGSGVSVGLSSHPTSLVSSSPVFYDPRQPLPFFFVDRPSGYESISRTIIGSDVWIGEGAKIKSGLTIGVGCVIGAGSLITKNVPPYSIVGGVPGRILRKRFSDEMCEELLGSRWWESEDSKLAVLAKYMDSPEVFLSKFYSL